LICNPIYMYVYQPAINQAKQQNKKTQPIKYKKK